MNRRSSGKFNIKSNTILIFNSQEKLFKLVASLKGKRSARFLEWSSQRGEIYAGYKDGTITFWNTKKGDSFCRPTFNILPPPLHKLSRFLCAATLFRPNQCWVLVFFLGIITALTASADTLCTHNRCSSGSLKRHHEAAVL